MHQYVNNLSRKDQVMPVQFPDVSPTKAKPKGGFNMVAGDFLQVNHHQITVHLGRTSLFTRYFIFRVFFTGLHHFELLGLRCVNILETFIYKSYAFSITYLLFFIHIPERVSSSIVQIMWLSLSKPFISEYRRNVFN